MRLQLSLRLIVEILNTCGTQERVTFVVYDRQPVARSELQERQSITERVVGKQKGERKNVYMKILKEIRRTEERTEERQNGTTCAEENSKSADAEHTAENAPFEVKQKHSFCTSCLQ